MRATNKIKRILAGIMAASMAMSLIPTISFAAQSNEYVYPADVWMEANGRTNEFDVNATTTYETAYGWRWRIKATKKKPYYNINLQNPSFQLKIHMV